MKTKTLLTALFLLISASTLFAQTTAFTYQGKLDDGATSANGSFLVQFRLFASATGGSPIGPTLSDVSVQVVGGVFSAKLDFLTNAFTGSDSYLEISVRRNSGESYTTLNPRQQITSSPYSIRTLSAAQADLALDSNKLGGIDASEYVSTASVGSSFVRNSTTQQTANFNVSGNGTLGGTLQAGSVRAQTANGAYGFTHTDGTTTVSSYISASGGWLGTRSNSPLNFFTNDGTSTMTLTGGNVGVGTTAPTQKLDVFGAITNRFNNSTHVISETTGGTNSWARFYMRTPNRSWAIGTSRGFNGDQFYLNDDTAGVSRMTIQPNGGAIAFPTGNVGIGTSAPNTRLTLSGGAPWTSSDWTASMNMQRGSALGWEANASGQRFGIGHGDGGLYFLRTSAAFGQASLAANYDLRIRDTGDITQPRDKGGLVKALIYVGFDGSIRRCYNGITGSTTGNCGITVDYSGVTNPGVYALDFPFQVNDRFVTVTAQSGTSVTLNATYNFTVGLPNRVVAQIRITDVDHDGSNTAGDFMIIVY